MNRVEKTIGYRFHNNALLLQAFTHSSFAHDNNTESYERLEFLGDSILGFVTAEYLFHYEPFLSEGTMSRLRSDLVCEQSLFKIAKRLNFGEHLRLSHGEISSGGRERVSILADTVEAVIAAIFLDDGLDSAKRFIYRFVLPEPSEALGARQPDYKSALQEYAQKNGTASIIYHMVAESGPDHDKHFIFNVSVNGTICGEGEGRTKKEAEQNAAAAALNNMK